MDYLVMKNLDLWVIVLYFVVLVLNGLYWSKKPNEMMIFS